MSAGPKQQAKRAAALTLEEERDAQPLARQRGHNNVARAWVGPRSRTNLGVGLEHAPDDVYVGCRRPRNDAHDACVLGPGHRWPRPRAALACRATRSGPTRRGARDSSATV